MRTTLILSKYSDGFWDRIWGYWRSPAVMKMNGLWSDRKEQQLKSFLMTQRGRGKSRPETFYEKLAKPKYNNKWVKK
ncbi:hypothetical protein BpHYR1_004721 [Brachionus plicatilis]|uniref:Uncharacterized protein n=1 Tax=Brachionus plicatilis TaxID=10195 RepID=A0A3M7S5N0_BRAPC|nr:hypothetical protein BpHYR1_004721 [Brachionus plicatilis]